MHPLLNLKQYQAETYSYFKTMLFRWLKVSGYLA